MPQSEVSQPEAAVALRELRSRRLVPPPMKTGAAHGIDLTLRPGVDYRAKYRGALLGVAIGDALGRPWEGRGSAASGHDFAALRQYRPWRGWQSGPIGTVTDDTQLTMCVAESLLATGRLDPADLSRRMVAWLPVGRGKGRATTQAVTALTKGSPWNRSGVDSAGNGAAMRVAPIGLLHRVDPNALRHDAALSAVVTHASQMAVVSAIVQAFSVAHCLHRGPDGPQGASLCAELLAGIRAILAEVEEEAIPERRADRPGPVRLTDRLTEVAAWLDATPAEAFAHFHNGAFVLESLPAALWCFLRYVDDPERALLTAVSGGYDADTVAAMTGALVGALHGENAFPAEWIAELEYVDEMRHMADGLLQLAGEAPRGIPTEPHRAAEPVGRGRAADRLHARQPSLDREKRILGCLLGGAIGDALGAPIEFASLNEIRATHGPAGVTGFVAGPGPLGSITDDTQMTLFTAEGLIRAANRHRDHDVCDVPLVIWHAYQRWLDTQGERVPWDPEFPPGRSGWLVDEPALRHRRAPGTTCLSALRSGRIGTMALPLNQSKGCGGVMRVAPVGLVADNPFDLGCEAAALTHGHPAGYLAAGVFAAVIAEVAAGQALPAAIEIALELLQLRAGHQETLAAVRGAQALAANGQTPSAELVETLGEGWIAEEALGIALYCALVSEDFGQGLLLAVNHGGDSDSTGSLTGNVLGATAGLDGLPAAWLQGLAERWLIEQVATDLAKHCSKPSAGIEPDLSRYPSW